MKYIGYYDTESNRRTASPAAVDKMTYIAEVLSRLTGSVEILSCSTYSSIPDSAHSENIKGNVYVKYIRTRGKHKFKIGKLYDLIYDKFSVFFLLMKNIRRGETIIVYHSLLYMRLIRFIKMIKKLKVVLEVEEIYNDVGGLKKDTRDQELKFIQLGDAYLFPTEIMNRELNKYGKRAVIVHGAYNMKQSDKTKFCDGKIHVVYAGTFEKKKGGAQIAINSSPYLPKEYKLHILGFGSEEEVKDVKQRIKEAQTKSKCEIVYEGKKTGKDYIDFISQCDLGLSSQNPEGVYNNTSFPSKILSYMCNGLKVVSVRIPVVETSDVKNGIWFYETSNPEKLAEAILEAGKIEFDPKKMIEELNTKFEKNLKELLEL